MTDHTELRRLAEAANTTYEERASMPESKFKVAYGALKTFEAAANPATILSLLDRLEKAEKDAARYQWLRERYTAVDFDWEESGQQAVIFTADYFPVATASCDETIDLAMEASK